MSSLSIFDPNSSVFDISSGSVRLYWMNKLAGFVTYCSSRTNAGFEVSQVLMVYETIYQRGDTLRHNTSALSIKWRPLSLYHSPSSSLLWVLFLSQCRVFTVNPVVPPSHRDGDWVKQHLFLFWLHNGRHVSFLPYFILRFSGKNPAWSDGRPNRIEKARFVGNQSVLGRFEFSTAVTLCNQYLL